MFTDVYGLREGDDVRMAGVRVGRVEKIDTRRETRESLVRRAEDQHLYGNTVASVTYQNIVGQRYLGLSLGTEGSQLLLPPGSVIPLERTEPSFDVTALLNGYEPLFSLLNPHDADNLTKGSHRIAAGRHLVDGHAGQPDIHAHRDIRRTRPGPRRGDHQSQQGASATSPRRTTISTGSSPRPVDIVAELDRRRPELVSSVGSLARVMGRLSASATDVYPARVNSSIASPVSPGTCSASNLRWRSSATTSRCC